jgi:hypothetical protein
MKRMRVLVMIVLAIFLGVAAWVFWPEQEPEQISVSPGVLDLLEPIIEKPADPVQENPHDEVVDPEPVVTETVPPTRTIPAKALLNVPFAPQAPFGDWELPYKEACEEASVIMVNRFYRGQDTLTPEEVKTAIDDLVAWAQEHMNGKVDSNVKETARYFTEYLEYDPSRVIIIYEPTIADMKAVIASGYPVIIPAAGRDLGNENFRDPGPLYHMLVIIGYEGNDFITHDPGTRNGAGYRYNQDVLYEAIHDLTPVREDINSGRKAMIVVKP